MNRHIKLENLDSFGEIYSQLVSYQEMIEIGLRSKTAKKDKNCLIIIAEDLECLLEELALDFDYGKFATPFSASFIDRSETIISEAHTILNSFKH